MNDRIRVTETNDTHEEILTILQENMRTKEILKHVQKELEMMVKANSMHIGEIKSLSIQLEHIERLKQLLEESNKKLSEDIKKKSSLFEEATNKYIEERLQNEEYNKKLKIMTEENDRLKKEINVLQNELLNLSNAKNEDIEILEDKILELQKESAQQFDEYKKKTLELIQTIEEIQNSFKEIASIINNLELQSPEIFECSKIGTNFRSDPQSNEQQMTNIQTDKLVNSLKSIEERLIFFPTKLEVKERTISRLKKNLKSIIQKDNRTQQKRFDWSYIYIFISIMLAITLMIKEFGVF